MLLKIVRYVAPVRQSGKINNLDSCCMFIDRGSNLLGMGMPGSIVVRQDHNFAACKVRCKLILPVLRPSAGSHSETLAVEIQLLQFGIDVIRILLAFAVDDICGG